MASMRQRRRSRLSKAQRRQRQTRKTRAVRRQLRPALDHLPGPARALCDHLGRAFRKATALRFGLLLAAALLTVGRHTAANLMRTLGPLVPGDPSSYRGERLRGEPEVSAWARLPLAPRQALSE